MSEELGAAVVEELPPEKPERTKNVGQNTFNMVQALPEKLRVKVGSMNRTQRRKWFKENRKKIWK